MIYYIYNGDELLGLVYNNNTYYYHKNVFGDILGILNSNYEEIVTYEYDSWGAISSITDNSGINLGTINPFRYRSYYYDEETKLYYLNSRYYNPEWGRFINADSYVSTSQGDIGHNMFCYCGNNSINRTENGKSWFKKLINGASKVIKNLISKANDFVKTQYSNWIGSSESIETISKKIKTSKISVPGIVEYETNKTISEIEKIEENKGFYSLNKTYSDDSVEIENSIGGFKTGIEYGTRELYITFKMGTENVSIYEGIGISDSFMIEFIRGKTIMSSYQDSTASFDICSKGSINPIIAAYAVAFVFGVFTMPIPYGLIPVY